MPYLCNHIILQQHNNIMKSMRKSFCNGILIVTGLLLPSFSVNLNAQDYKNSKLSPTERAKDLLSRLTLEEKAQLMQYQSRPIDRLGIPQFNWWSEALHGVGRNGVATVFPITVGMASSFNEDMVQQVFDAVSDEARAKNNISIQRGLRRSGQYEGLSFWTPNINIFRDPRWGRGQETYGEDPYLTTKMGLAVVRGLQGPTDSKYTKLLACAKHFAVHSGPEWNRHTFNVELLPARDLYETYLPAFKSLVQEGDVWQVMCAYQRFEGEPCCGSERLLQQILRNDWGFKRLVVSDCWAINDFWNPEPRGHGVSKNQPEGVAKAVLSGTDLECGNTFDGTLPEAVKQGLVSEEQINQSLLRLLEARFMLGDFDSDEEVEWRKIGPEVIASKEHKQLALDMARQSMVLLQNKGGLLPLKKNMKIAVIGPNAADSTMLWGNYNGYPSATTTILQGITEKVGANNVTYISASGLVQRVMEDSWYGRIRETPLVQDETQGFGRARVGLSGAYWNNRTMQGEPVRINNHRSQLAFDNGGATVFAQQVNLENFSATYTGQLTANKDESLEMLLRHTDCARVIVNGDTLYNDWGKFTDDMRDVSIPLTVKKGESYDIKVDYAQGEERAVLRFNIAHRINFSDADILKAVEGTDAVVFVGGISPSLEGEEMRVNYEGFRGGDRTDIELPKVQHDIVSLIANAGHKIVFVNCSGSAMNLLPETQTCSAILQAWYAGEQGGQAVADVLFGDFNPSGKLPVTFYKSSDDLPDFLDYNMKGRTYRYFQGTPLWQFGYGLSYTTFSVGAAKTKTLKGKDALQLTVPLQNTGDRSGAEVLQVYIKNNADVNGPLKSLRGYKRVELQAGEKTQVAIQLSRQDFEFWDATSNTMRILPGTYTIYYGTSSSEKDLQTLQFKLK